MMPESLESAVAKCVPEGVGVERAVSVTLVTNAVSVRREVPRCLLVTPTLLAMLACMRTGSVDRAVWFDQIAEMKVRRSDTGVPQLLLKVHDEHDVLLLFRGDGRASPRSLDCALSCAQHIQRNALAAGTVVPLSVDGRRGSLRMEADLRVSAQYVPLANRLLGTQDPSAWVSAYKDASVPCDSFSSEDDETVVTVVRTPVGSEHSFSE